MTIVPHHEWEAEPAPVAEDFAPETSEPVYQDEESSEVLTLPLQPIFARLPNSLASVVQSQGNEFISLPARKIAQELPKGAVRIPFGELRKAAPAGTFFDNDRLDQVLVELPLVEIISRLHPSLLARRSDQRQIHVAPEITNVFGPRGEGISLSTARASGPKTMAAKPTEIEPVVSTRGDTTILRRGDTAIQTRGGDTSFRTKFAPSAAAEPPVHHSPTAVVTPFQVVAKETVQTEVITVSLASLSENWPEMVRLEMRELKLTQSIVALPVDKLTMALRSGKIIFTWKQICAWLQPAVDCVSGAQVVPLELPLSVIAPLFIAKHREAKDQKKLTVEEAPDLFAKKGAVESKPDLRIEPAPVPVVTVATPPAPSVTPPPATVAVAAPEMPKLKMVPAQAPDNITPIPMPVETPVAAVEPAPEPVALTVYGKIFNQPTRRDWSPAEILKNLVTLPGVVGSFLAMQDGLLIAAELPSSIKAETVAAFLPQIFGRMNQYTKELKLGGLSSLTLVVENVSWQIVKSGTVYLVALSHPGENLPSEKLNTIATEFGKQMQ